jgi:hypothetical protein
MLCGLAIAAPSMLNLTEFFVLAEVILLYIRKCAEHVLDFRANPPVSLLSPLDNGPKIDKNGKAK